MFIPDDEPVLPAHFLFKMYIKWRFAKISEISGKKKMLPQIDADKTNFILLCF